ncbi:carbohydrate kinase family protein [Nocardioides montaniterrae]
MSASRHDVPEAVVIGEAIVDLIDRPGRHRETRVGGSPLNVAVGLRRLGVPTALQTSLGDDAHGALIRRYADANDVALLGGPARGRTSTAVARIGADGAAAYDFDVDWSLEAFVPSAPRLLHTGSIAAVVEPGASVVLEAVRALRSTATISYDPNVRPLLMGEAQVARKRIEELVSLADVVKASDEDLAWLYPDVDQEAVARWWHELGPALVVVTRGALGAYAVGPSGDVRVPTPPVTVADTIGAGDSFMAGLLAALGDAGLLGRDRAIQLHSIDVPALTRAVAFAASCAAVTVQRHGADPPRRADLASP